MLKIMRGAGCWPDGRRAERQDDDGPGEQPSHSLENFLLPAAQHCRSPSGGWKPSRHKWAALQRALVLALPATLQECSAKIYFTPSGRMRIRAGSMTEKCPSQSVLSTIRAARLVPTSATGGIGNRSNTMPEDAGRPARQASHQNPYRKSAQCVLLARPMPVRLRL